METSLDYKGMILFVIPEILHLHAESWESIRILPVTEPATEILLFRNVGRIQSTTK